MFSLDVHLQSVVDKCILADKLFVSSDILKLINIIYNNNIEQPREVIRKTLALKHLL